MFMVIFTATSNIQDDAYDKMAKRMREKAFTIYNCIDFISTSNDAHEVTISYWKSLLDIQAWKNDIEHVKAQNMGQKKWYSSYKVEICEITRSYTFENAN